MQNNAVRFDNVCGIVWATLRTQTINQISVPAMKFHSFSINGAAFYNIGHHEHVLKLNSYVILIASYLGQVHKKCS